MESLKNIYKQKYWTKLKNINNASRAVESMKGSRKSVVSGGCPGPCPSYKQSTARAVSTLHLQQDVTGELVKILYDAYYKIEGD